MAASPSGPGPAWPKNGTPGIDPMRAPWSRAPASCRSVRATASPSMRAPTMPGSLLDGRCDVLLSGHHAAGPVLDHHAVRSRGSAGRQFGAAAGLHQPGDHPPRRRQLRRSRSARARGRATGCRPAASRSYRAGAAALRHADRHGDAHRARRADARDHAGGPACDPPGAMAARRACCSAASCISATVLVAAAHGNAGRLCARVRRSLRSTPSVPIPSADAGESGACRSWTRPSRCRCAATTCRDGPLKFSVPISQAYTSVSFYTRADVAYYAINDRAAGRRVIELDLDDGRSSATNCRRTKTSRRPTD